MTDVDWPRRAGLSAALDEAAIVAITDRAGRILYCNDKFEAVSGYSREELIGQTHRVVNSGVHARDYFRNLYRTIARGEVWRGTIQNRTKSGEPYWVDTTIVPNLGADGRPETYTAIRFEVSDHVRALKALELAQAEARQAAEVRDRFFANISHEVRTPLNAVLGLASALAHTALTPRQTEMLKLITGAGDALRRVLDDMLDLSKMQAGQFSLSLTPFDLRTDIETVVEMRRAVAEDKGLTLDVAFTPSAQGKVIGDGVRITQIVSNLVSNAVKFTTEGRVSVRVDVRDDEGLVIEVEDTGMGFDAEAAQRLFKPFVQADDAISRQYGGTGLGLSICKSLAELMGGQIAAESAPGEGSLFRVVLPVERAVAAVAEPASTSAEGERALEEATRLRILAVEDNPANQMVVRCLLEPLGFEIVTADNGLEGVLRFQQERFDMVLMDMQMPVMDGLDAMRRIRADEARLGAARTPIVMLTANTTEAHHLKAVQAGADHLVAKPVTLDILVQGMEQGAAAAAEWSSERALSAA
ncbi:diguanylate cyclase/phosphodiesterase (GGDEF & EAL domains) with PAS/PAC sensor(s) [Brevundimonas diminuta 3F5N]|uniref:histidine kinase n=1 Tax=Brevundimonas diminuta 3F5N TaxID=1255603 RepID=A0A1R4F770_BREDI|nr:PAS domain-containing hybrid sensor histidine kinase/response regulator [Brevundimonas diminuta]SJM51759.1 diguanylate cyclase/phosphodiesterase (GGDEF & EAL domains) with PAS/PAC sensor(s) [Brevundimonas diminuta 3F5N]